MAQFRVALGLALISLIACIVQASQEQDGIKARGAKFGEVTVEETKEACKARCAGTDACEFWTWYYPAANPAFARRCSMYGGDITESRTNSKAVTGSMGDNLDQIVDPQPVVDPVEEILIEEVIEIEEEVLPVIPEEPACPMGFHQINITNDHCYAIFPGKDYEISHPEAREACQDLGADLVAFDTKVEFDNVVAFMKGKGGQTGWWWWTALVRNESTNKFDNGGCPAYITKYFKNSRRTDCAYLKLKGKNEKTPPQMQAQMGKCKEPRPFICETPAPSC